MQVIKKNRWDGYIKTQKPCSNSNCKNLVWCGKYCPKCRKRLKVHGDINTKLSRRQLEYNENIVQDNSPASHYFIGWITSDGYIDEKYGGITLEICDKEILDRFKEILGYSGQIKVSNKRQKHHKQAYRLNLKSRKLTQDFVNIGIKQKKSKTIGMPKIDQKYYYHFLRGLIEGDGSIILDKRQRLFVFFNSASKKLIDSISNLTDIKPTSIITLKNEGYDNAYRLVWTDKKALELCEFLYKDSENLRLERKYQKYIQYKNLKEQLYSKVIEPNFWNL